MSRCRLSNVRYSISCSLEPDVICIKKNAFASSVALLNIFLSCGFVGVSVSVALNVFFPFFLVSSQKLLPKSILLCSNSFLKADRLDFL